MGRSRVWEIAPLLNHYEEHVASSVIVWGTMLLLPNLFVLSFQGSLHLKRTATLFAFLHWLVNMTLCPAEQKKGSSPRPIWLACRSRCVDEGNEKEVMLVKTKQTSMWNKESYFRRQGWRLLRPSAQVVSLYRASAVLRARMLCNVWSFLR